MGSHSVPLTRRDLPERDPDIEALDPDTRQQLGALWAERAKSELGAASAFSIVVTELYEIEADTTVIGLAARAAHDEVRHSELCRLLAERYLNAPVPRPRPKRVRMPDHPGADRLLQKHLHVVGLSCINETLAVGFVDRCLEDCRAPLVRIILKEHQADEIEHARIGWAHLASEMVDAPLRRAIQGFLPRLLRANLEAWRSRLLLLPERGVAGHGYPPRAALDSVLERTVQHVIIPGFAHVGIDLPALVAVR